MSADFTPEKEDYKILTPFKMQVLTNFPYIEADFDALTNYQLLCKIVEYLNEVIKNENEVTEQITSLYNAYTSLQNYVNNYFDNLDVEEEINNKLDEMASDGSLTNLIKNYIDPIYQSYETRINDEVNNIKSQVDSLASGSPLVVSDVSKMTDTTRVYVNTSNGNWYYYDGDSWEIGGTYQSTGIGKNKISMYNLDTYINNSVDGIFSNIASSTLTEGKIIDGNGNENSESATYYEVITAPLNGGEKLKLKTTLDSQNYGTKYETTIYALYDSNNDLVDIHKKFLESGVNTFEIDIEIPENVRLIKMNCATKRLNYLINASLYKQKEKIGYNDLDATLKSKFNLQYSTKLNPTKFIENAYLNVSKTTKKMSIETASNYNTYKVPITPNKYYLIKNAIGFYNNMSYGIGNNFTEGISYNDVTYNINVIGENYNPERNGEPRLQEDIYFQAPGYATYLYINTSLLNESIFEIYEANNIITETVSTNDLLYGKKYVACGDSFTHGDFTGYSGEQSDIYDSELQMYKTYPYWIGKRNSMTVINEAINGSIMALDKTYVDSPSTVNINTRDPFCYQRYQQIPNDADYITIMFGLNDMYHTYLGTINDTTNTTFYGALNIVLSYLIEHHPDARIGVIVSNAYLSDTYRNALKEVSVKWGVGYLDLYNDPSLTKTLNGYGMSSDAITLKNSLYYVSNDNHHPNVRAHKIMSEAIENFLRKL